MGAVYQRKSDGRWVAALSKGPRTDRIKTVRYAATRDDAEALLAEMGGTPLTPSQRFWAKVDKSGDCWEWTGFRVDKGYGRFGLGGGRVSVASRFAYEDVVGSIPAGRYVCHRCDNPPCVRPDHLFLGTAQDNTDDMVAKGRHAAQRK